MFKLLLSCFVLVIVSVQTSKAEVVWTPMPVEAYKFGERYPDAQHLLYAFDYGHALVYERLLLNRGTIVDPAAFEKNLLRDILAILKNPPVTKVDEADIAPNYVYKFPLVVNLFDWSHLLHQFVLDVLATSVDRGDVMKARVNELFTKYKTDNQLVITDQCKTMLFMDAHYFSKAFRSDYPSFNLLIWSYHWFQIRLYEALLKPTQTERDLAVNETVKQFWEYLSDLPDSAPFDMMPETAVEAPTFAAMFPRIPSAFDNNHMLHDITSDILTSPKVLPENIRTEAIRFGRMAQDPGAFRSVRCPSE